MVNAAVEDGSANPLHSFAAHLTAALGIDGGKVTDMTKWILVLAVCFVAGCQTAEPRLTFDEALKRTKAQAADVRYAYEEKWATFNNSNRIDEKNGCYKQSTGSIQQVLVIDNSGVVTNVIADVDNAKSRCFRQSYLHVQFPVPPFAPYYLYLRMR